MTGPAKILAVDDEADFELLLRQRFRRQIREREFTFLFAHHGEEALSVLAAEPDVDLILLDINMPVMDGLKLVSLVRQNPQLKHIPIIIITTEGAEEDRERGLALGANAYISKPIQSSHLIKTIGEILQAPPA